MKKYLKFIPHIIFAGSLLFIGAKGKLLGEPMARGLFEMLGLFGQPEHVGRILVGLGELFAGVFVFVKPMRRLAAFVGSIIMIGAIYFHITKIGMNSSLPAFITLGLGIYIFFTTPCVFKKKAKMQKEVVTEEKEEMTQE